MATPISFTAYVGWVDATDPNNIPAEVKLISAEDLLRYENFGLQAAAKINSIESTVEGHTETIGTQGTTLAGHTTTINGHTTTLGTLNTSMGTAQTDITNLKKLLVPTVTKTANYTTVAADQIIIGNGATAMTVTLMSAVTAGNGKMMRIKNRAASVLTVASAGGTIDGTASKTLAQWASLTVVSDGTNWYGI